MKPTHFLWLSYSRWHVVVVVNWWNSKKEQTYAYAHRSSHIQRIESYFSTTLHCFVFVVLIISSSSIIITIAIIIIVRVYQMRHVVINFIITFFFGLRVGSLFLLLLLLPLLFAFAEPFFHHAFVLNILNLTLVFVACMHLFVLIIYERMRHNIQYTYNSTYSTPQSYAYRKSLLCIKNTALVPFAIKYWWKHQPIKMTKQKKYMRI